MRLGGDVWLRCRAGEADPDGFGDSDTDIGIPPIRYALLHDFACLNKCEVLGSGDWGELIMKPEGEPTGDDLALLDQIASLTLQVDSQLTLLRSLIAETTYGQSVKAASDTALVAHRFLEKCTPLLHLWMNHSTRFRSALRLGRRPK